MKKTKIKTVDKKQNQQIKKLQRQLDQLQDRLKRSLADYSNLEKRIESQRQIMTNLATASVVSQIIEVLDDLYLVSNHLKDPGLTIVVNKFEKVLKDNGVESISSKGKIFDPETMDCVEVCSGKQDRVVKIQKKGYKLNGQVIRPAQVIVGRQKK